MLQPPTRRLTAPIVRMGHDWRDNTCWQGSPANATTQSSFDVEIKRRTRKETRGGRSVPGSPRAPYLVRWRADPTVSDSED